MKKITNWLIHINGQVQGVGFRPYVYKLAKEYSINGWVSNTSDGLDIEFNADKNISKTFYDEIVLNAPQLSHITSHYIRETPLVAYEDFKIINSNLEGNTGLLISPDFAICEECSKDITDIKNRRYLYTFTTCTQCGPRYSIIKQLPYDRENTTMDVFKMCKQCVEEYYNPLNRRHFSQTNSCPDCAVVMKLYDNKENILEDDQGKIISKVCELWKEGKTVAIKGIGGYLLTCDAANENAIKDLRFRKHRPSKPFALMFPDVISLDKEVYLNETEINELKNVAAPIVLLQLKENTLTDLALHEITPGLSKIGVMLPYTPLYQLLLQQFLKPIVATSGNTSNAPIVFRDDVAMNELNIIADSILVHNREIITPQDDSVVYYSPHYKKKIMLRRARGFAPLFLNKNFFLPQKTTLCTGGMMKSTFTLMHKQNIHVSQYLGDTDNYDSHKNYDNALHHFLKLFHARPEIIIVDKHPAYYTSQFGEQLAKKWDCKLVKVQHQEAHFASVLGEHNLLNESEAVLGVVWDGTGYGDDGQIWGGEFFTYHQHRFSRTEHFEYFNHFLGDKMAMEPRLSAFALCHKLEEAASILQPKFTATQWSNYQKLISNNKLKTSSVGRIFDAVASLLELIDKASFEGEAAMLMEEEALRYFKSDLKIPVGWLKDDDLEILLSPKSFMKAITEKITEGKNRSEIAAWFHVQLILAIKQTAIKNNCRKICFSGGVFQNGLLVDLILQILGEQHELYFNKDLSPNDENISFGQLMCFAINEKTALQKKV